MTPRSNELQFQLLKASMSKSGHNGVAKLGGADEKSTGERVRALLDKNEKFYDE